MKIWSVSLWVQLSRIELWGVQIIRSIAILLIGFLLALVLAIGPASWSERQAPSDEGAEQAVEVRLRLAQAGDAISPERPPRVFSSIVLHLEPYGVLSAEATTSSAARPRSYPVELGPDGTGVWRGVLDPRVFWALRVEADGLWAAERSWSRLPTEPVEIVLHPAGRLLARLEVPRGEVLPSTLRAVFRGTDPGGPAGEAACRPGAPGVPEAPEAPFGALFECPVPAGRLELALRAPGFAPVLLAERRVEPGAVLDLGTFPLVAGVAVTGRVVLEGVPEEAPGAAPHEGRPTTSTAPSPETRLELRPVRTAPDQRSDPAEPVDGHRATADATGRFVIDGVRPGVYALTVRRPGYAVRHLSGLRVGEAGLDLVRAVVLTPPLTLEVEIVPPVDPSGVPWRVELASFGAAPGRLEPVTDAPQPAPEGAWSLGGLAAGRYVLRLRDGAGTPFHVEERRLEPEDPPWLVVLDLVEVEGSVRLGESVARGEALAGARVVFGTASGMRRVDLVTEDDGTFAGVLPEGGLWPVEVLALEPPVRRRWRQIEVEPSSTGGPARLELVLPATRLEGEVVDAAGRPVPGAALAVTALEPAEGLTLHRADADGRFELHGLAEGLHQVEASDGDRASDPVSVELAEDRRAPALRLVVEERRSVVARVVGPDGPVPGARVEALPLLSGGSSSAGSPSGGDVPATGELVVASADLEGRVELRLPPWAAGLAVTVLAPGHALAQRRVNLPGAGGPPGPIVLPVAREGGTVRFVSAAAASAEDEREGAHPRPLAAEPIVVVGPEGSPVSLGTLQRWAVLHGAAPTVTGAGPEAGRLTVPALAPGRWVACRIEEPAEALGLVAWLAAGGDPQRREARCGVARVVPGGVVEVVVP